MNRIEILNALSATIADLRVARSLLYYRMRGTNDSLFNTVQEIDRTLKDADKAMRELRQMEFLK